MKQLIIIFTIMFSFLEPAIAQNAGTVLKEFGLKGNVKEVIEYIYRGEINATRIDTTKRPQKTVRQFDKNGRQIEQAFYDENGTLQFKLLFDYTVENLITESQFNKDGKLTNRYIYKYDNNGNKIEFDTYQLSSSSPVLKVIYKYDPHGNRIKEDSYNQDSRFIEIDTLLYNEKNQKTEQDRVRKFPANTMKDKVIFSYDSSGNEIKSQTYGTDDKLTGENSSSYSDIDSHGNWTVEDFQIKGNSRYQRDFLFKNITKRKIKYYQ